MSKSVYMRMTIFMVLLTLTSWRVAGQCAFTAAAMPGCPGETGSIQLGLTGVSPWQIAWTGASSGSQNSGASAVTLSELASGSYSLTVTDGGGCSSTQTVSLVYGFGVTTFTQSQICDISPDGTATGIPYGGLPPYSYLWSNGSTLASQQGLAAGTYTVTVTDERGCTTSSNATVSIWGGNEGIWIGETAENVTCFGANDGSINAMPMSGTAPYSYAWNTGSNTMAITNLSAGTYTVTVTDVNGCVGTRQVTITQPPLLAISVTATPACGSASNGSINLTVTGGTTPYTYYWSNGANSEDISNLSAGSYSITVADANGCTATTPSNVLNGATPTANITGQAQYCSEAAITLLASGGTNYLWSNGTTTDYNIVTGPGTYTVTVSNAQGCTSSTQYTVSPVVTLSAVVTYNACMAGSNGNINLSVSGGQAPYTYVWSNAETAEDLSNVAPGTYTVTVTDLNGCTASASYNISNNPLPQVAITGSNVICAGSSSVLTATGGGTYLWSTNAISASITVNVAGTYTVTVTNASGCTATASRTLTVNPAATASITGLSTICAGGTSVFTAGGGGTYLWSTGAVTPAITVSTAGAYTVTVTNATGCTATASRTLTVNPTPTASIVGTSVICAGGSTTFTAGGGGTYLWSTGATSASVTLNTAGIYTVTVTNASGCTSSANRIVQVNPLPVVNITGNTVICAGGSSIFTATGGGTYAWSNGATGASITVSTAGTYTVTVTNSNGCTATASRSLTVNPSPTASITGVSTICGSGTSTFTATGGSTYAWSNGAVTASITVGTAGTYTVTVTNAVGCTATASRTFTIGQFPNVTISGPSTICSGQTATLVASGGIGGTYLWSTGFTVASNPGITAAGTYTVTVTNSSGCTGTATHTLAVVPTPTASISGVLSICAGQTTTLTANGGDTYLWNTSATTPIITVSTPGTYTVTVTSGGVCTATKQVTVGPVIEITAQNSVNSCEVGTTGNIDITVTGGTPPYNYLWSTGATTEDISNVSSGAYIVTVTDMDGCSRIFTKNFGYSLIQAFLSATQATCGEANGTISLQNSGGIPPYSRLWSNGSSIANLTGLAGGTYTVTTTDASGCTRVDSTTVSLAPELVVNYTVTPASCTGMCNGAIDLTISGGTGPYQTNWAHTPGTNDAEDASGLCGGTTYTGIVYDQYGCTKSFNIFVPATIELSIISQVTTPTCNGESNGAIDITLNGGQPPYNYDWTDIAGTNNAEDRANLASGTYAVIVTDANGCATTTSIAVAQLSIGVGPGAITKPTCFGASNGSINLTITGGQAPYTYLWSTGAITEDLLGITAGTYTLTVTDIAGCTKTQMLTVTQPSVVVAILSVTPVSCSNMNNGAITITATGGTPIYSYIWSDGSTMGNRSNLEPGVYTVTITDSKGCTSIQSIAINATPPISTQPITSQSCGSTTINASATTGGNAPYTYLWSNAVTGPINVLSASGNYSLTITDANGCTLAQTFDIEVIPESDCAFFAGRVVSDDNNNCLNDAEPGLGGWIVRATGPTNTYYGLSNSDGSYYLGIQGGATYSLEAIPPGALWTTCPPLVLSVPAAPDTIMGADLPAQHPILCPELEVTLASGLVRRCLSGNMYSMSYCNNGTAPAENAYIVLSMDALTTPVSSNLPFTNLGNNNYRFNLGNLAIGQCGNFNVFFNVSCAANLGQTLCASAHIYPDSTCMPINALWSGASLQLSSTCNADSLKFNIKNVGFGPMNEALEYIVVEDHVMLLTAPVQLGSGQSTTIAVPSNGSTWYMSIPQVPYHPGHSMPALAVEGCTPNPAFSTGFVNQFPLDEADPWIDVDCKTVTGSLDPNDKTGFPIGYGEEHYIAPGTALNYLIRFQNTGTDTAFTVLVVDTLSQWLDPATIRAGASSHPYTFDLTGEGIASFLFENIFLPDSNINEAASHGFVQFSILPKITTPLETVLENTAAIYFDLNEPVFTNTTQHRLGEHFITVGLWQPARPQYEVSVTPNPSNGTALISVKGLTDAAPLQLQVVDLYGKVVLDRQSASHQFRLDALDLPEGLYLFRVVQEGVLVGTGKIIIYE